MVVVGGRHKCRPYEVLVVGGRAKGRVGRVDTARRHSPPTQPANTAR